MEFQTLEKIIAPINTPFNISRRNLLINSAKIAAASVIAPTIFSCSSDSENTSSQTEVLEAPVLPEKTSEPNLPTPNPTETPIVPEKTGKIASLMKEAGIPFGYFGTPIEGATFENIFTYPEMFGVFGTQEFLDTVKVEMQNARSKGLSPILTFEPGKDTSRDILGEISSGKHDDYLKKLFTIVLENDGIFRPMHEMDTSQDRYPWSGKSPEKYIRAWKHLYKLSREIPGGEKIKFLWSPAGEENMMNYYPGDAYVEVVGFSQYDYPAKVQQQWYGKVSDISLELKRKLSQMPKGKEIYIPEFGIAAESSEEFYKKLGLVLQTLKEFPSVKVTVFFNSNETLDRFKDVSLKVPQDYR